VQYCSLSLYGYAPGVADPCLEIEKEPSLAYSYANKANLVAVITNGTAVLGLGDIGAVFGGINLEDIKRLSVLR